MTKGMDGFKTVEFMNRIEWVGQTTPNVSKITVIGIQKPVICRKIHLSFGNVKYCLEDKSINYLQSFLKRQHLDKNHIYTYTPFKLIGITITALETAPIPQRR